MPVGCAEAFVWGRVRDELPPSLSDAPKGGPLGKPVDSWYMDSLTLLPCGTLVRLVHCSAVLLGPVGTSNDVPEPVSLVLDAGSLTDALAGPVFERNPLSLDPSVCLGSGPEARAALVVTDTVDTGELEPVPL